MPLAGNDKLEGNGASKGNSLLRYLWTEAAMHAVEKDAELKRLYRRQLMPKGMGARPGWQLHAS